MTDMRRRTQNLLRSARMILKVAEEEKATAEETVAIAINMERHRALAVVHSLSNVLSDPRLSSILHILAGKMSQGEWPEADELEAAAVWADAAPKGPRSVTRALRALRTALGVDIDLKVVPPEEG